MQRPTSFSVVRKIQRRHMLLSSLFAVCVGVSPRQVLSGDVLDNGPLTSIEKLLAIEEIRLVKARYCAAVDDHDWAALRSVFADDATFLFPWPGKEIKTADDFVGLLAELMPPNIQTRHHAHNLQIDFISATEASVRWDHENWTWFEDGSRPNMHQWGQYRERYRKTDKGWRISYFSEDNLRNAPLGKSRRVERGDPNP